MLSQVKVAMLIVSYLQFLRGDGVKVLVEPPHMRVSEDRTNLTITCRADNPLTACQFSWWDSWDNPGHAGHVLDLSRGQQPQADPAHLKSHLLSYGYSGRGLQEGECGVRLEVEGYKTWLIACRVRADHGWVYNWTTLFAADEKPLPHTLEPREVVALQGGVANISLKAQGWLIDCSFRLPGGSRLAFRNGAASPDSTGRHLYQGAGLGQGGCGLTLANITHEDNGLVEGGIGKGYPWERRLTPLILARPPTPPVLQVLYNGAEVTATCTVQESRPVANITWVMGQEVIRQDSEDDSPVSEDDAWRWPWTAGSTSQRLTRRLQPQDSKKVLKCSVSHVALTEPLQASEVISFRGTSTTPTTSTPTISPNTPLTTVSNTTPTTLSTATPSTTTSNTTPAVPSSTSDTQEKPSPSMTPTMLGVCQELWARASQLQNTCCVKDGAAAATAQVSEEIGRLNLEAAKSRAKAAELEVEAARTWAKIAEEKLQFDREWHKRQLQ